MTGKETKFLLLSTRVTEETGYQERRSSLAYDYVTYFEKLDYTVVPVPCNTRHVECYFQFHPEAVVITGGNTVPNNTDSENPPQLSGVYPERERVELQLMERAIELRIPILGICRGMQMINRYFGGQIQHGIPEHVRRDHRLIADSCETLDGMVTNSYHGDGITRQQVATTLRVLAESEDGMIEALVHDDHRILGIQWHPERQDRPFDDTIIFQLLSKQICP